MIGRDDELPHSLVPLALAVLLVRTKVYSEAPNNPAAEYDALATVIAAIVPIYEYSQDPGRLPQSLMARSMRGGLFRRGGKELHFLDGRPSKHLLAVRADDVASAIEVLKQPGRTAYFRSDILRRFAASARKRARAVTSESKNLRQQVQALLGSNRGARRRQALG